MPESEFYGFHLRDGFCFTREGDEIVIGHFHDGYDGNRDRIIRVSIAEWASAVASTTVDGETSDNYLQALNLLKKKGELR